MLNKLLTILFVCVSLVSCASRDAVPLEASQFILTKNLFIQSGYSDVFFQDNGPIRPLDVNQYEPFCRLKTELTSTARTSIEVVADEFTITKIDNLSPDGEIVVSGFSRREGVRYITVLVMESHKQPFIHSLVCQRWTNASGKIFLDINDIEKIIGNFGEIQ